MPAYSFDKRFVPAVESGEKDQTIRRKRKRRPRPGQRFVGYYAMRTKHCRKLVDSTITAVADILLYVDLDGVVQANVAGAILSADEREVLAKRDGFAGWRSMVKYWEGLYPFEGDLIRWKVAR